MVAASGGRDLAALGTLAIAYAEAGRLEQARATADRAIGPAQQSNQSAWADDLRKRMDRYLPAAR